MIPEHDEALVERVAQSFADERNKANGWRSVPLDNIRDADALRDQARAIIYPPAPPKTRLQVARELLADNLEEGLRAVDAELTRGGKHDDSPSMQAILAALALPAMED